MTQELEQFDEKKREPERSRAFQNGGLLNKYTRVEIFAYALAGFSAIAATWSSIGKMHAENIRDDIPVTMLKEVRKHRRDSLWTARKTGSITAAEYFKGRIQAGIDYRKGYAEMLSEMGIKNTLDKWRQLPSHQRIGTALTILGVLSIAGVAIFTINKERSTQRKLDEARDERAKAQAEVTQHMKNAEINDVFDSSRYTKAGPITLDEKPEQVVVGDKTKALLDSREYAQEAAVAQMF